MEEFEYEEIRRATDEFSPAKIIGKGSHGCVYKGELPDGRIVAVKKLSSGLESAGDNSKFDNEVSILSSLLLSPSGTSTSTTSRQLNIVHLLGVSRSQTNINKVIVMEFMPNGSLHDLLHSSSSDTTTTPPTSPAMTWPGRVQLATQIARAIQFLHTLTVVHRDVKSSNVLFDQEWTANLADFGLALRSSSSTPPLPPSNDNHDEMAPTPPAGTIGYLDPTYIEPSKFSPKNDVFSFGVLLLEIFSRRKAFDVTKSPPSLVDWAPPLINNNQSSSSDDNDDLAKICGDKSPPPAPYMRVALKRVLSVAAKCVAPDQKDRPSMDEVVVELDTCYAAVIVGPVVVWPGNNKWTRGLVKFAQVVVMGRGRRTWEKVVRRSKRRTVPADNTIVVDIASSNSIINTSLDCTSQKMEYCCVHNKDKMMLKDFLNHEHLHVSICNNIAVRFN